MEGGSPGGVDPGPGTQPYPWPWDGRVRPEALCLLIAGVQRCHAGATPGHAEVLATLEGLARSVRNAGGTVCHLRHVSPTGRRGRPRPLLPAAGTPQAEAVLVPCAGDSVVTCAGHDGFYASDLDARLWGCGIRQLVVGGLAAEVTVSGTVRGANDRGYECLTPVDTFGALDPTTARGELGSITMSGGIFGAIGTRAWLVEALGDAAGGG